VLDTAITVAQALTTTSRSMMTLGHFRAESFATEPMVGNIIDFTWDARGRMWAVETNDYPNTVLPDSVPGSDRILIIEDANRDGRADRVKVCDRVEPRDEPDVATADSWRPPRMLFFRTPTATTRPTSADPLHRMAAHGHARRDQQPALDSTTRSGARWVTTASAVPLAPTYDAGSSAPATSASRPIRR
jgi:hypothetical protein